MAGEWWEIAKGWGDIASDKASDLSDSAVEAAHDAKRSALSVKRQHFKTSLSHIQQRESLSGEVFHLKALEGIKQIHIPFDLLDNFANKYQQKVLIVPTSAVKARCKKFGVHFVPGIKYYKVPGDSAFYTEWDYKMALFKGIMKRLERKMVKEERKVTVYENEIAKIRGFVGAKSLDYSKELQEKEAHEDKVAKLKASRISALKVGRFGSGSPRDIAFKRRIKFLESHPPKSSGGVSFSGNLVDIDDSSGKKRHYKDIRLLITQYEERIQYVEARRIDPIETWIDQAEGMYDSNEEARDDYIESLSK
ncbi:hypothetical protein HN709_00880 [Candidatus Peregrinibacteria bacterium]|jgi:hypothetical protein|nr:hypothetical protein [Candidatus Peregrinibacteria bacterium]